MQFKDYYQTLGIEPSAGEAEIKTAYRRLARKYHPDVSKEAGAEEKFKAVNEAYEALRDPAKRKAYDQLRAGGYRPGDQVRPPPGGKTVVLVQPPFLGLAQGPHQAGMQQFTFEPAQGPFRRLPAKTSLEHRIGQKRARGSCFPIKQRAQVFPQGVVAKPAQTQNSARRAAAQLFDQRVVKLRAFHDSGFQWSLCQTQR